MHLGNFSISLAVKDLQVSKSFYEALGFEPLAGEPEKGWLILGNGDARVGLFQGMFETNILTFNPGWDRNGDTLESFEDVREIQARLDQAGLEITARTPEEGEGPGHIVLADPDGNSILIDQHVPKPGATIE